MHNYGLSFNVTASLVAKGWFLEKLRETSVITKMPTRVYEQQQNLN